MLGWLVLVWQNCPYSAMKRPVGQSVVTNIKRLRSVLWGPLCGVGGAVNGGAWCWSWIHLYWIHTLLHAQWWIRPSSKQQSSTKELSKTIFQISYIGCIQNIQHLLSLISSSVLMLQFRSSCSFCIPKHKRCLRYWHYHFGNQLLKFWYIFF